MLPFLIPALVGAAASVGGAYLQNEQARKNSAKQMAFQERMSSTSHQREVVDLRMAGLNPILSATGGAGASTPAGSAAPVVGADIAGGAASAVSATLKSAELEQIQAQTDAAKAQASKADEEAETIQALRPGAVAKQNAEVVATMQGAQGGAAKLPLELQAMSWLPRESEERIRQMLTQGRHTDAQAELTRAQKRLADQTFEGVGASAKAQAKIDEALSNSDIGIILRLLKHVMGTVRY